MYEVIVVSIMVNGSPAGEFKPTRELRQRDLLKSFLFLIVVEGLANLVRQETKLNLLHGVKIGTDQIHTNTLQFADDTLFFCEANKHNVFTIKIILRCFELASGLRVNFHKSKIL